MEADIVAFLGELHPETDFSKSQDYVSDGLLDSFDLVSLVAMIEDKFALFIDALDIVPENFASVDAIAGLVRRSGGGA